MSVESLTIALHHSRAKGSTLLVLLGIANHDGDGGSWPSVATLAKYARCSDRHVQRALARLVELGEVDVQLQQGGTQHTPDVLRPNRYLFRLACPGDCDRTSQHRTARDKRTRRAPGRPRNPVTPTSPGDTRVTPPGDTRVTPPGDAGVTRTIPTEPTEEPAPLSAPTTEGADACGQPPAHSCDHGWLHQAGDGPAVPCLVCRPHLRGRT